MKFLRNLVFLSLPLRLLAATPETDDPKPLAAEPTYTCGGRTWTHNKHIGAWGPSNIVTKIYDNKIYIENNGVPESNIAILLHLDTGIFPNNQENQNIINSCVNPVDPFTSGSNLLGPQSGDEIPCNGKRIRKNTWLTYYQGGDEAKTYSVVKIYNGLLMIQAVRKEKTNNDINNTFITASDLLQDPGPGGTNASLLENSYKQGNTNSSLTHSSLSIQEIDGCIYKASPRYAVPLSTNNCASNPVIGTISAITQTSLSFSFTGANLPNLTWRISGPAARNGKTGAVNNSGVNISFASLEPGTYTLAIEGGDCTSEVSSKTFTVNKPNCANRPEISTIRNITATGLTVDFTGINSPNTLEWRIKNNGGTSVANSKTGTLSAGSAGLTFGFLANGNYTLEISGGNCVSTLSSKAFAVNVSGDSRPTCQLGPNLKSVYDVTHTSLKFNYHGEEIYSLAWKIMNKAGTNVASSSLVPDSDRLPISFNNLSDGEYTLEIQGGATCKSTPTSVAFNIGNPLPIYISNFEGQSKKEGVSLTWKVVSEKDGDGFQVLRYNENMKDPKIIADIPLSEQRVGIYSFLDENPANGANYYQLKQIDNDGSFTTSKIIAVQFERLYDVFLAPNPAREFVDVAFESRIDGTANFETYSVSGTKVMNSRQNVKIGNNLIRLNVSGLSEGNYIIKIQNGDQTKSLRFMKMR